MVVVVVVVSSFSGVEVVEQVVVQVVLLLGSSPFVSSRNDCSHISANVLRQWRRVGCGRFLRRSII